MKFKDYIKEKIVFIIINLMILIFTGILLKALNVDDYAIIFVGVLNFIGASLFYIYDYCNKRKYYKNLLEGLNNLDKKYLISAVMEEPNFLEGKILYEIIEQTDKAMNDEIATLNIKNSEYKDYIELWVHEIKTPIASSRLTIENNPSPITKSIEEDLEKVENYIEQALFYNRSNNLEKDYLIREISIKQCINTTIKRNARVLIEKGIQIQMENIDKVVYADSKWVEFIINQIISNSIKYMKLPKGNKEKLMDEDDKKQSIIKIYCIEKQGEIILNIEDNGIGISENSIGKVFEKGYTGESGRIFGKSTGIGLYLCKNLCKKLGLSIKITSKKGLGTTVSILFPINKLLILKD
ncbi:ATP-binding protein [Clostridium sp. UBA1056]|uniref:sensor histidine kinase n=1 Tax=unclassified Clostridium TaxID=2614128 RepID=UPI00321717C0